VKDGEISLFDDISVSIDSKTKNVYNIQVIEQIREGCFNVLSQTQNKTNQFILPVLSANNLVKKDYFLYDTLLENSFITYTDSVYSIVLLYRFSESVLFSNFEKYVVKHPLFIKTIDIDFYHVMYLFNIPAKFQKDIVLFKEGKYSKLSYALKESILRFFDFNNDGVMAQILSKSDKRRVQLELELDAIIDEKIDLYSIPDLSKEVYIL
jgi:hypothetical protein